MKLYRYIAPRETGDSADVLRRVRLVSLFRRWHARAGERRELAQFPSRCLRDIGADWQAVRREAAKPFWRA